MAKEQGENWFVLLLKVLNPGQFWRTECYSNLEMDQPCDVSVKITWCPHNAIGMVSLIIVTRPPFVHS